MRKGFRQQAEPSSKQRFKQIEAALNNLQMGLKISQMFAQQQSNSLVKLNSSYDQVANVAQGLDYRTRAMLDLLKVDTDALETLAAKYRLEDFNKQSDEEDKKGGYEIADDKEVTDKSVVILTSTCAENSEAGIFRVKFHVQDVPHLKGLKEALVGKKVGDKFDFKFNNLDHTFELLGIRYVPEKKEVVQQTEESVAEATETSEESND